MQSGYPWNQSEEVSDVYGGYDLTNRKVLSLEWKNDVVMDDKSGDDDTRDVRWLWRRDESGRGRSLRHGWRSEEVDSRGRVMHIERNDW